MSHLKDPPRSFLSFRMMLPKGSSPSPKLLNLLNTFEEALSNRLKSLKPTVAEDILSLSWMRSAMESLSATHDDIKVLITSLELPVCDWDDNWIDVYLGNSINVLDICIVFASEISRLQQDDFFLQCILHSLKTASQHNHTASTLSKTVDEWRQHITRKNPRLDDVYSIMDTLSSMLDLPKIKKSPKGKVLMQAMYGVKVVTLFVASVFASALTGSVKKLMDLQVSETYLWSESFTDLQHVVNGEIENQISQGRSIAFKELKNVDRAVRTLQTDLNEGSEFAVKVVFQESLEKLVARSSQGLDLLKKEMDNFFRVVLTGRDDLLSNFRVGDDFLKQTMFHFKVNGRLVAGLI